MITGIITFLVIVAVIGSILYGRRLVKAEKTDAVFGNPERAKGGLHWVIVGTGFLLLSWLYFSWDIAKSIYPNSANELCQVAKVNESLLSLKYLFPIEERQLKSTALIKRETENINNRFKKFSKLKIAICGDILHSRVARSNIEILSKLGANINVIGPKELIPKNIYDYPINVFYNMKKGLQNCDIVMMLRIQKERILGKIIPNEKAYFKKFGLDYEKLSFAKKNAFVMHPGPMNRGVEIDTNLADDINRSVIREQVELGVAVRIACLKIYCKRKK